MHRLDKLIFAYFCTAPCKPAGEKKPKLLQDGKQASKGRSSSTTPKLAVAFYSIHTRMDMI